MNSKLVSLLASVCILCILIIIGEWYYAVRAKKHALSSTPSAEVKLSHDEMPGLELTRQSEESYADLVARPLFIKGRRPVEEPSQEEAQALGAVDTFDWQLNGVYTTKKGLSALFSRSTTKAPKDNHRKISTGTDLDGWKLTEIHDDKVILKQGSQQKELLLRKPKSKELSKKTIMPNQLIAPTMPNAPSIPNAPDMPPPPAGDFENSENENF
jgi:hypothetical protein